MVLFTIFYHTIKRNKNVISIYQYTKLQNKFFVVQKQTKIVKHGR